jgi:hypothetical protein
MYGSFQQAGVLAVAGFSLRPECRENKETRKLKLAATFY